MAADSSVELQVLSLAWPTFPFGREAATGEEVRLAGFPEEWGGSFVGHCLVRERDGGSARDNREVIVEDMEQEPAGD